MIASPVSAFLILDLEAIALFLYNKVFSISLLVFIQCSDG